MGNGRKLSAEQRSRLAIDGYLVLPGMLAKAKVKRIVGEVDRLQRKYRCSDAYFYSPGDQEEVIAAK